MSASAPPPSYDDYSRMEDPNLQKDVTSMQKRMDDSDEKVAMANNANQIGNSGIQKPMYANQVAGQQQYMQQPMMYSQPQQAMQQPMMYAQPQQPMMMQQPMMQQPMMMQQPVTYAPPQMTQTVVTQPNVNQPYLQQSVVTSSPPPVVGVPVIGAGMQPQMMLVNNPAYIPPDKLLAIQQKNASLRVQRKYAIDTMPPCCDANYPFNEGWAVCRDPRLDSEAEIRYLLAQELNGYAGDGEVLLHIRLQRVEHYTTTSTDSQGYTRVNHHTRIVTDLHLPVDLTGYFTAVVNEENLKGNITNYLASKKKFKQFNLVKLFNWMPLMLIERIKVLVAELGWMHQTNINFAGGRGQKISVRPPMTNQCECFLTNPLCWLPLICIPGFYFCSQSEKYETSAVFTPDITEEQFLQIPTMQAAYVQLSQFLTTRSMLRIFRNGWLY